MLNSSVITPFRGIIRAIDISKDRLYVITPVSPCELENVDILLRGCLETPACLFCRWGPLVMTFYYTRTCPRRECRSAWKVHYHLVVGNCVDLLLTDELYVLSTWKWPLFFLLPGIYPMDVQQKVERRVIAG